MTKPTWIIDSKLRLAYYGDGVTIEFHNFDGQWKATLQSRFDDPAGPDYLDDETLEAQALDLWQEQMETGVGFLRFAGTTLYGENWIAPMALATKIEVATIQAWLEMKEPLAMNDARWPLILMAMLTAKEKIEAGMVKVGDAFIEAKSRVGEPWSKRMEPGIPMSQLPLIEPPHLRNEGWSRSKR
jgi:hypothetical protein